MTSHASRTASSSLLRRNLGGSFTARIYGLLATEFILLGPGREEFGRLRLDRSRAAEFVSKDHVTVLEASGRVYRMITDDEQVLVADSKGRSGSELEISCGGRTYEAQVSLFRNLAVASNPDGERAVQLSGGLMGRNYRGLFDAEDACAHSVAIFLLWHVVANRRRAYRTGGGMM